MKKTITIYIILLPLLIMGSFLFILKVRAETNEPSQSSRIKPYQIINLEPGWNIISTPKVISGYEFSIKETAENLDIYLLDPDSPSGWQTMQEAGQDMFQPLFAYFINNKTNQVQTLKLFYDFELTPNQRLFERSLSKGWNAIGIANPEYAIKRQKGATVEKLGKKAHGIITVYNEYSTGSQSLAKGTRFVSDNGKMFKSIEDVVVPGFTIYNNQVIPGTVDVKVEAVESGEEYNIGPSLFTIPGFKGSSKYKKFYGESVASMTGGGIIKDINNPSKILYSIIDCISDVIDFTADQSLLDSVKVGDSWESKISTEIDNLNDFRELKGYGVFVTKDNCLYRGSQNVNDGFVVSLDVNNPTQVPLNSENQNLFVFKIDSLYDLNITSLSFSHSGTGSKESISNFELYDVDTGELLGSLTSIDDNDNLVFQNLEMEINSENTKKLKLVGDINLNAVVGETHIFTLDNIDLDYEVTITNLPISNEFSISQGAQPSSIDVALASLPTGAVDGVKGQTGVEAMAIIFTAGNASDMTLTDLVLTGYVADETIGSAAAGIDSNEGSDLYAKNVVTNVSLYEEDGTTLIAGPKGFSGGTSDSDVTFDNLSWTIPAGTEKKMIVKVDITTTATSGTYDYVYFDIDATTDVTALDSEGNSRNPSSVDINDTPSVYVKKSDGGSLTVAAAASGIRPESTYVYMGQTSVPFSKFKFTATDEAFKIDKLTIEIDDSADRINVAKVELEYPIDAAGTLVSTRPVGYFGGTASITFDLTGKEMYVPKDDYAYLTVYADIADYNSIGDQSADNWSLDFEGDGTTTFHAVGEGSSKVIEANATGIADADGQTMYLYRVFPTFTLDGPAAATGATMATRILEFTVTNNGDYDLVFNSTSGQLKFDVLGSGAGSGNATFTLYKSDGTQVDAATVTTAGGGSASATFDFTDTTITIPAGGSQSFYIEITSGKTIWDENGDWLQLKLQDEADVVKWVDGSDTDQIGLTAGLKNLGIPMIGPEFSVSGL